MSRRRTSRRWLGAIPLLACAGAWFATYGLRPDQRAVAAIFALSVGLWLTHVLPLAVTALLSTALLVLAGGVDEKTAFGAYGDPVILLFVGSFFLAKAMEATGLDARLALWTLSRQWACTSASRLVFSLGAVSCTISLFVSNTATAAMLFPICTRVIAAMKAENSRFATALMLMLTWGASVAVGFPVGTPPNLIAMGLIQDSAGRRISFIEWMAFGMPITILMVIAGWLVLRGLDLRKPPDTSLGRAVAYEEFHALPRISPAQRNTVIAFALALILWVLPDLTAAVSTFVAGRPPQWTKWLQDHVTPTVAALGAATLLFLLPTGKDRAKALTWRQAAGIDWGTILLFGGGIALGQAMFSSGLAKIVGAATASAVGAESVWALTAVATALAILTSELASNTAAATTVIPVAIGLAQGAGVSPIAPALGAALGASLGFMLPVSTPPNAIVFSSGLVSPKAMATRGLVIDLIGWVVTVGVLRVVLPLLHLA